MTTWRIWFHLLEAAGLDVQLVNARDIKNAPGRPKTDAVDASWLGELLECGLLKGSFIPPGGYQGGPGRDPLPPEGRPGTVIGDTEAGRRAPGRRDQAGLGGFLHRHGLRPGDDPGR